MRRPFQNPRRCLLYTSSVQLSFINQGTQRGEAEKAVNIPAQEDAFNSIRTEYRDMLKNQLAKGNNGLVKAKYITFAIEADSLGAAKSRLALSLIHI